MQATSNEIHGPQLRRSTAIDIDNTSTSHLPTVLNDNDDQSTECEAPPPSPIQLDSSTKRVMSISTMDRTHKQIVSSQNTLKLTSVITHSEEKGSEVLLTLPIKIEETNQHGLI